MSTNLDWPAFLAAAEREVWADYDGDLFPPDTLPVRPDRGWRRLGTVIEDAFAGILAAGGIMLVLAALVFTLRVHGG